MYKIPESQPKFLNRSFREDSCPRLGPALVQATMWINGAKQVAPHPRCHDPTWIKASVGSSMEDSGWLQVRFLASDSIANTRGERLQDLTWAAGTSQMWGLTVPNVLSIHPSSSAIGKGRAWSMSMEAHPRSSHYCISQPLTRSTPPRQTSPQRFQWQACSSP